MLCQWGTSCEAPSTFLTVLSRVDDAGPVAFGICEDDVVSVQWPLIPVDLSRTKRQQPRNLLSLLLRVKVEMNSWWNRRLGSMHVKRKIRSVADPWAKHDKIRVRIITRHVVERRGRDYKLTFRAVYSDHDRAHTDHATPGLDNRQRPKSVPSLIKKV